jgi:hypothetical protein
LIREAFESIFHASRIALTTFLLKEVKKLSSVEKDLLYEDKFKEFFRTLHLKYSCNGDYPKEKFVEEFNLWLDKVEEYVNELESKTKGGS